MQGFDDGFGGIERARIDCDVDNVASRRVIEKNGGRFDGEEAGSLYFWVPTSGEPEGPGPATGDAPAGHREGGG